MDESLRQFSDDQLIEDLIVRPGFVGIVVRRVGEEYIVDVPGFQDRTITLALLSHAFDKAEKNG